MDPPLTAALFGAGAETSVQPTCVQPTCKRRRCELPSVNGLYCEEHLAEKRAMGAARQSVSRRRTALERQLRGPPPVVLLTRTFNTTEQLDYDNSMTLLHSFIVGRKPDADEVAQTTSMPNVQSLPAGIDFIGGRWRELRLNFCMGTNQKLCQHKVRCDRMLGVHAFAPHDPSRTSARGSCGRHKRSLLRPRLIHRRCRQMRLKAGPACIRRVSPRAHTLPHSTAHTGTCSGAHTCARSPMSTCATSHTHTAPLAHALDLTRLCAHAHMHMHKARQTASHTQTGYHRKDTLRHTRANTYAQTYAHAVAYIHTYTHEHTQTHKRTCARTHTYTNVCVHV